MIEIRFKDIDPDTGSISQDKKIAVCETETSARWVLYSLNLSMKESGEPNRIIYSIPKVHELQLR